MREIVGAMIGEVVTNNRETIAEANQAGKITRWLDRKHMQLMAAFDLGKNWELMATGATLFCIDSDGKPQPPNAGVKK